MYSNSLQNTNKHLHQRIDKVAGMMISGLSSFIIIRFSVSIKGCIGKEREECLKKIVHFAVIMYCNEKYLYLILVSKFYRKSNMMKVLSVFSFLLKQRSFRHKTFSLKYLSLNQIKEQISLVRHFLSIFNTEVRGGQF